MSRVSCHSTSYVIYLAIPHTVTSKITSSMITARKRCWGKVMFSQVSVCQSISPWGRVLGHMVGSPLRYPTPPPIPCPRDTLPLLLTSGGHHWRPVLQTCSLEALPPPPPVLTYSGGHRSRWYASYWNAFLLLLRKVHIG